MLVNALAPVSAKWFELGTVFGFTPNDLNGIMQGMPHNSVVDWLTDMLHMKMSRSPEFGWSDVIDALTKIGCVTLAESIQHKHCPQGEDTKSDVHKLIIASKGSMEVFDVDIFSPINSFLVNACLPACLIYAKCIFTCTCCKV